MSRKEGIRPDEYRGLAKIRTDGFLAVRGIPFKAGEQVRVVIRHQEDPWYTPHAVSIWEEIQALIKDYSSDNNGISHRWVFRGEYVNKVPCTKLEAAFKLCDVREANRKKRCERSIIRQFQRKASLHMKSEPHKDDILEWLAVMQHHGALTRLLDFTYSFYVAVYFALAREESGSIWAIKVPNKSRPMRMKIKQKDQHFRNLLKLCRITHPLKDIAGVRAMGEKLLDLAIVHYLMKYPLPSVYPVNPFRLNKRLTAQQGCLCRF